MGGSRLEGPTLPSSFPRFLELRSTAVPFQAAFRGLRARRALSTQRVLRGAATVIQAVWRGQGYSRGGCSRECAWRWWCRGWGCRRQLAVEGRCALSRAVAAAITVQAAWRAGVVRAAQRRQAAAAVCIQCRMRRAAVVLQVCGGQRGVKPQLPLE